MKTLHEFQSFSFSVRLALVSFGLGTLLFLAYFLFPDKDGIIILGLFYIVFAAFFNSVTVFALLIHWLIKPPERKETGLNILILLANIPIAALYTYLILHAFRSGPHY